MDREPKFNNKAEILPSGDILIPDISFLTKVKLPPTIDLRETSKAIDLLSQFVSEEKELNRFYRGSFLNGSLSRGQAKNGSDIDMVHVLDGLQFPKSESTYVNRLQYRLKAIYEYCYGIQVQDNRGYMNIQRSGSILQNSYEFDKFTIALGIEPMYVDVVNNLSGYQTKQVYSGHRPFKSESEETGVHHFKYRADKTFPWFIGYGLREEIFT